jgi:hypothetical protein
MKGDSMKDRDDYDLGGDYARDGGWSGGGARDDYTREPHDAARQPFERPALEETHEHHPSGIGKASE